MMKKFNAKTIVMVIFLGTLTGFSVNVQADNEDGGARNCKQERYYGFSRSPCHAYRGCSPQQINQASRRGIAQCRRDGASNCHFKEVISGQAMAFVTHASGHAGVIVVGPFCR